VEFNSRGGSRAWTRLRDQVVREEPVCRIRLPGICTIASTTANHRISRKRRPDLTMVRANLEGACRPCNMRIKTMTPAQVGALRCQLAQRRRPAPALAVFG
jgi:5-methylcytosine-specific restriction endonuclease McrA